MSKSHPDDEMITADARFRVVRFGTGPIHIVALPDRTYALCGHVTPTGVPWPLLEPPAGQDEMDVPLDALCRLCGFTMVRSTPKPPHW